MRSAAQIDFHYRPTFSVLGPLGDLVGTDLVILSDQKPELAVMTFLDFAPLLLGVCVAGVSGAYLGYLILKSKDEECNEHTVFEANESEIKVPKLCFSPKNNESENILKEIQQKTSTRISFKEVKDQSIVCKIEGSFENIEKAKSFIRSVISNHFAQLLEEIECSKKHYVSSESNEQEDKSVGDAITKDLLHSNDRVVTLPAFKPIKVFVSSVMDPNCFWVQLIDSKATELEELEKEMNAFYADPENSKMYALGDISVNDLVAAPFNSDDSLYRACVVEVVHSEKGVELELFYVDYGDDERIERERVFLLKPEFLKLKFQAVQCSLANVEPRRGQWSEEAVDYFCSVTDVAKWKVMEAEAVGVGKNGEPVLKLFEENNGRLIDVADELVRHNYASYCSKQRFAAREERAEIVIAGGEEYDSDDELDLVC